MDLSLDGEGADLLGTQLITRLPQMEVLGDGFGERWVLECSFCLWTSC